MNHISGFTNCWVFIWNGNLPDLDPAGAFVIAIKIYSLPRATQCGINAIAAVTNSAFRSQASDVVDGNWDFRLRKENGRNLSRASSVAKFRARNACRIIVHVKTIITHVSIWVDLVRFIVLYSRHQDTRGVHSAVGIKCNLNFDIFVTSSNVKPLDYFPSVLYGQIFLRCSTFVVCLKWTQFMFSCHKIN